MTEQEQINDIMDYFNFDNVAKAMAATNWTWHESKEPPAEPEIRTFARKLLNEILERKIKFLSTGGFTATFENEKLGLCFTLEEWEAGANTALLVGIKPIESDTAEGLLREVLDCKYRTELINSQDWCERARKLLEAE